MEQTPPVAPLPLAFVPWEGFAEAYLEINGKWEDHVLTSLTNREYAKTHA